MTEHADGGEENPEVISGESVGQENEDSNGDHSAAPAKAKPRALVSRPSQSRVRVRMGQKRKAPSKALSSTDCNTSSWKTADESDTAPQRRNFIPRRQPGFQLPRNKLWSPSDLFSLFFSEATINTIVHNTNVYAIPHSARRKSIK